MLNINAGKDGPADVRGLSYINGANRYLFAAKVKSYFALNNCN